MAPASRRALTWRTAGIAIMAIAAFWLLRMATQPQTPLLSDGVLRVGIDPSNPPFAFDTGSIYAGFEVDLAHQLAERLGAQVRFVALGFDGAYDALRVDQVDVLIAALAPDPTRTRDVIYSRPYYDDGLMLTSLRRTAPSRMEIMSGRRLAYAFGSFADAEARAWSRRIAPFTSLPYETPAIALDAARLGDADAALVQMTDARLYLRDHPDWDAVLTPVTHAPFAMALRSDRERLSTALDHALAALQADGSLDRIIAQWF